MTSGEKDLIEIIGDFYRFESNVFASVRSATQKHGLTKTSSVMVEVIKVRKALEDLRTSMFHYK
jgi:hypothetical protein